MCTPFCLTSNTGPMTGKQTIHKHTLMSMHRSLKWCCCDVHAQDLATYTHGCAWSAFCS